MSEVPLASTFMLSTKKGKEAYVEPVIEGRGYRFSVKVGMPQPDPEKARLGTTAGKRHAFQCLMSGVPVTYDHIRAEGKAGRMGARLMAIVAEGDRGRVYLAPDCTEHEAAARQARCRIGGQKSKLPREPTGLPATPNYGLAGFSDLFTPRQLVALTTFSDLVGEARVRVERDAIVAGLPDDSTPLREGGTGATAYAEAVGVYLACGVDYVAQTTGQLLQPQQKALFGATFARQALPMTWDYAEAPPFCEKPVATGSQELTGSRRRSRLFPSMEAYGVSDTSRRSRLNRFSKTSLSLPIHRTTTTSATLTYRISSTSGCAAP